MLRHHLNLLSIALTVLLILCLLPAAASAADTQAQTVEVTLTISEISVEAVPAGVFGDIYIDGVKQDKALIPKGSTVTVSVTAVPAGQTITVELSGAESYEVGPDGKTVIVKNIIDYEAHVKLIAGNSVSVTFNGNGGAGEMQKQEFLAGVPAKLRANEFLPPNPGKRFGGWAQTPGGSVVYADEAIATFSQDTTLYAVWVDSGLVRISFHANGGSGVMDDQYVTPGEAAALNANAFTPPQCHVFEGWALTPEGEAVYGNREIVVIQSPLDLYAVWKTEHAIENIPRLEPTCTTEGHTEGAKCAVCGTILIQPETLPALGHNPGDPVKENYIEPTEEHDGSYDLVVYCTRCGAELERTHVIVPKLTPETRWTVTYYGNGADAGVPPVDAAQYRHGDEAVVKDKNTLEKTGYTFGGWEDGTGSLHQPGSRITVTQDTELHARWVPNTYTVHFAANGGTGIMNSITCTYGDETSLPHCTFEKNGHVFAGWAPAADTGVKYGDKAKIVNLTAKDRGTVTLYAVWNPVEQVEIVKEIKTEGGKTSITKTDEGTIIKDDKTAKIDVGGAEVIITYKDEPDISGDTIKGEIDTFDIYYAKVVPLPPAETQTPAEAAEGGVSYAILGLTDRDIKLLEETPKLIAGVDTQKLDTLSSAYKVGGMLSGTLTDKDLNDKLKTVGMRITFTLDQNWVEKRYGTNLDVIRQKIKVFHIPDAGGHTVSKDYDIQLSGGKYILTTVTYDGFSSYAVCCDPIYNTVRFDLNGGKWPDSGIPDTRKVLEDTPLPADAWSIPVKEGNTFVNWYTDKDCKTVFDKSAPVTGDITLYAKWDDGIKPPKPSGGGGSGSSIWITPTPTPTPTPAAEPTPSLPDDLQKEISITGIQTADRSNAWNADDITDTYNGVLKLSTGLSADFILQKTETEEIFPLKNALGEANSRLSDAEQQVIAKELRTGAKSGILDTPSDAPVIVTGTASDGTEFVRVFSIMPAGNPDALQSVSFAVPLALITESGMTVDDVVLYRGYPEYSIWKPLNTTLNGTGDSLAYYTAETTCASPVAVVFTKDAAYTGSPRGAEVAIGLSIFAALLVTAGIVMGIVLFRRKKADRK